MLDLPGIYRFRGTKEDYKIPQALDALALPGLRSMEQPQFRRKLKEI